jgi:transcriptional regulator with GAF, ATPase, and Fis domain
VKVTGRGTAGAAAALHLVLVWSGDAPDRVGEVAAITRQVCLGRGTVRGDGDPPKLEFNRCRPGANEPSGALDGNGLSRRQWLLSPRGSAIEVQNVGKNGLLHNGARVSQCLASVGDTLGVEGVALFLLEHRPRLLPTSAFSAFAFGTADASGLIGESAEAWRLRREIEHAAGASAHVLLLGGSGTGKELCARAVHRQSERATFPLLSRNAATIPETLVEAELFGNVRDYPNPGTPARPGVFGQAHRGTLFLDEIAELGEAQQASLLRVLDAGEYQQLGDAKPRTSDVRVVAATNRDPDCLKHDLLARFAERIELPSLNERRSDIALIARHLSQQIAAGESGVRNPSLQFTERLMRHDYRANVRELERLLRLAAREPSMQLELTPAVENELRISAETTEPTPDAVLAALAQSANVTAAARELGLPSRYALYRLMKRLGISAG